MTSHEISHVIEHRTCMSNWKLIGEEKNYGIRTHPASLRTTRPAKVTYSVYWLILTSFSACEAIKTLAWNMENISLVASYIVTKLCCLVIIRCCFLAYPQTEPTLMFYKSYFLKMSVEVLVLDCWAPIFVEGWSFYLSLYNFLSTKFKFKPVASYNFLWTKFKLPFSL